MTLGEIQFGGMLLTTVLTLDLVSRSLRQAGTVYNRSRRLMEVGIGLIAVQFLLQYTFHFREMGVTQGVAVNLLFFMLSSWLICLAILNLQRRGHLQRWQWLIGGWCWLLAVGILLWGTLTDNVPMFSDTPRMRLAEYVRAVLFSMMQIIYTWLEWREFSNMKHALNNYYDSEEKHQLLGWMEKSVYMLAVIGLMVPAIIFMTPSVMFFYTMFLMGFIYYCVSRFINYGAENALQQVEVAEQNDDMESNFTEVTNRPSERTEQAIAQWTAGERYCQKGLNIQQVANEMGIAREKLSAWLKTQGTEYAPWLNGLRVEKAKRLLKEHPEYTTEAVANDCGFRDRSYFHRIFRELTGETPNHFQTNPRT